jgi:hypothetical protein
MLISNKWFTSNFIWLKNGNIIIYSNIGNSMDMIKDIFRHYKIQIEII